MTGNSQPCSVGSRKNAWNPRGGPSAGAIRCYGFLARHRTEQQQDASCYENGAYCVMATAAHVAQEHKRQPGELAAHEPSAAALAGGSAT